MARVEERPYRSGSGRISSLNVRRRHASESRLNRGEGGFINEYFYRFENSDDERRRNIYNGAIFFHAPCASAVKLCELARELVEETFAPFDPRKIQDSLSAEQASKCFSVLKPKFIHHPKAKEHIQGMLSELGCDL